MRFVRHSADGLAHASTAFVIVYLLAHGVIKLCIAINLLRGKSWIYPVAVAISSNAPASCGTFSASLAAATKGSHRSTSCDAAPAIAQYVST